MRRQLEGRSGTGWSQFKTKILDWGRGVSPFLSGWVALWAQEPTSWVARDTCLGRSKFVFRKRSCNIREMQSRSLNGFPKTTLP